MASTMGEWRYQTHVCICLHVSSIVPLLAQIFVYVCLYVLQYRAKKKQIMLLKLSM